MQGLKSYRSGVDSGDMTGDMRGNTTGICADGGTLEHPMTPAASGTGCVAKCPLATAHIIMSVENTGFGQSLNEQSSWLPTQLQPLS